MLAVGKYNAGLVDFGTDETTGRTKLVKVNDHIKKVELNKTLLSPERILEVKAAFLNALQKEGVTGADLSAIRKKLGVPDTIGPESTVEAQQAILRARFRPLTRREVRGIIDRYANSGRGAGAAKHPVSLEEAAAVIDTRLMPNARQVLAAKVTAAAVNRATSYEYSMSQASSRAAPSPRWTGRGTATSRGRTPQTSSRGTPTRCATSSRCSSTPR